MSESTPIEKEKIVKKKKNGKKIAAVSCAVVLFILLTASLLAVIFENKIAEIFLSQLYKNTKVEIKHKDISFSLIRKFPMASLQVSNIEVDGIDVDAGRSPSLLRAEMVFLQFSLLDIFQSHYTVRRIDVENASLHLIVNEEGENNWDIFIQDTNKTTPVKVKLNVIRFHNVNFRFERRTNQLDVATHFNHLSAKGNFSDHVFTVKLSTDFNIKYIHSDTNEYFTNKFVKLQTELYIDAKNEIYKLKNGTFLFESFNFTANASLQRKSKDFAADAKIAFKNIDVEKALKEMPSSIQEKISAYRLTAFLSGNINLNGILGKSNSFSIDGRFECKNGSIQNMENNISLSNTSLKGKVSTKIPDSGSQTSIHIESFSTNLNKGHIEGYFSISNLKKPSIDMGLKANIKLEDWQNFLPKNYLYKTSGQAVVDLTFTNNFDKNSSLSTIDFANANIKGEMVFTNVFLQMKEDENPYENLSGEITVIDKIIYANNLKGELKGNPFELNGSIENLLPYIWNENENLKINAGIFIPTLDLDKLLAKENASPKKKKEADKKELVLPSQIDFNLSFHAKRIKYQNFEAQNATGTAILAKKSLVIKDLQLNACNGKINAYGSIHANDNKTFNIKCNAQFQQIDVQKAFYAFNSFGQSSLTDKNIRGIAHCDVQFSAVLESNMNIISNSIVSQIGINITNGQLIDFKPMESLSKFVELTELQNMRFAALENKITIENATIIIPAMDIKNNALNLTIFGKQSFDGEIEYYIKMLLRDVLSKKVKAKKHNSEDFGEIIDDNTGNTYLHIIATGNINNPKFKWDAKSAKKGFQQQISTQKQELETIRQTANPEKFERQEKQKTGDKELNNSKKKQKEIEIDADW